MLIEWDDSWRVGNATIDYDHQMLVNITNQLWHVKQSPPVDRKMVSRILDQLIDYVKRHFTREEAIFMSSEYPEKKAHRAMHMELTRVVEDIATVFAREPELLDLDEVMDFLRRWLMDHILRHDMGYRAFVNLDAKPEIRAAI